MSIAYFLHRALSKVFVWFPLNINVKSLPHTQCYGLGSSLIPFDCKCQKLTFYTGF